jgi:hypothetical protein
MQRLISFPEQDHGPAADTLFLAVSCQDASGLSCFPGDLQALTPRIMQWDSMRFLLDLRPCAAFWRYQARQQKRKLLDCLKEELQEIFATRVFHAAAAETPWHSLLLLRLQEDRAMPGVLSHTSRFGKNLMRSLSWDLWWDMVTRYEELERASNKKQLSSFQQQKRTMQLAMRRLGARQPAAIFSMPAEQIQRRFGSLIADVWTQTFSDGDRSRSAFPWTPLRFCENPRIQRHLDFGTADWPTVEAYLNEDLNRLCVLDSFKKGERILQLEWMIVLCNLQKIPVSILFRHPHSLHDESPNQRTALLQISYSFQKLWQKLQNHEEDRIISWTLEVTEKIRPRMRQLTLFHESRDDWHALMNLENMLLKPLEAYQLQEDWVPEDSFVKAEGPLSSSLSLSSLRNLLHLGLSRPLFLYLTPQRLRPEGSKALWTFRERTMEKWWRRQGLTRDYFQFTRDAQMLWVFRDSAGECFAQGIYG